MKTIVPILAISVAFTSVQADESYRIDPVHSTIGFKIKHLYSKVTGRFSDVNGTIVGDPAKPQEARVSVEIKTASITTGDQKRDDHLRSPDFFDVELFPTMKFVSRKVNLTGEDTAYVIGDLTMHGVTKESILQVKFQGKGKDANGAIRTGWEAKTALKRSDYGLLWGKSVEGTQVVSDDVEIELNIEGIQDQGEGQPQTTSVPPPPPAPPIAANPPAAPGAAIPPAPDALPFVFLSPEQKATVPTPANPAPAALPPPPAPPVAPAAPATPPAPPVAPAPAIPAKPVEAAAPAKDPGLADADNAKKDTTPAKE